MDRYSARMELHGKTQRERVLNRLKNDINNKSSELLSYKDVKLNGMSTHLIINSGTNPHYKEFESLPNQKIIAGDYIEWANQTWIVYNADSDDEVYTDGNLRQCQLELYWQNSDGTIVSRYAYVENASAYNSGIKGNSTITLKSNQFMIYLPYDIDTSELDNGKRIHISRKENVCVPYEITRPDDVTYGFGEKGIFNIILTQDQYNPNTDKKITLPTGKSAWICDYKEVTPIPSEPVNDIKISFKGEAKIVAGGNYKRLYLTDKLGNKLNTDVTWEVKVLPENEKWITYEKMTDNSLRLKAYFNEGIIGTKILINAITINARTNISIDVGGGI